MAAVSVYALSAGSLRASSLPVSGKNLGRSLCAARNLVSHFQPVAAPSRSIRTETSTTFSPVCLLGLQPESRRRLISVQVNTQNNQVATASIRSVPVQVARELLNAGHRYLDVRTAEEFSGGHVEGAVNVPYLKNAGGGMSKNLHFLEEVSKVFDKDDEMVVGCLSGRRSLMAAAELQAAEYSNVTDMVGGYKAWVESGLSTSKA
ncbi:unnamed protein product [Calypogeia fissa]